MIPLRYGRRDAENPEQCAPEGRLPGGLHQLLEGAEQNAPEACHSHGLGHCSMQLHKLQLGWPLAIRVVAWLLLKAVLPGSCRLLLQPACC